MDGNPVLRFYKAITEIWKLFVLWMTLLKCIDLHDNLADELKWAGSSRSATFQCCWPLFVSDVLPLLL